MGKYRHFCSQIMNKLQILKSAKEVLSIESNAIDSVWWTLCWFKVCYVGCLWLRAGLCRLLLRQWKALRRFLGSRTNPQTPLLKLTRIESIRLLPTLLAFRHYKLEICQTCSSIYPVPSCND